MVCFPAITTAAGSAYVGVVLVVRDQPQCWRLELTSCEVVTNIKWTPIIDAYFPTSTLEHLPYLEDSLERFQDQYPIVLGYLKADIGQYHNPHSQQVDDLMLEFRLVDLLQHLWEHWQFRHMKTWSQVIRGRLIQARCDYILGTDHHRFEMVIIRDIMNYPSYHFAMQARLLICPPEAVHNCGMGVLP